MRKLASVQKIEKIYEHPNADRLNLAEVLGWQCVTNKENSFQEDDLVVYIEVDSILPDGPEWSEFLRERKFRIKTIKLRGELSQGLILPISVLPPGEYNIGDDVTETLGIVKYDPVEYSGTRGANTKGGFPDYVPKTNETRLQSIPTILDELRGVPCYVSVKLDGTSSTFSKNGDDILVCSRRRALKEGDNVWWNIAKKYDIPNILTAACGDIAIQGEICGPGIQKNKLGLKEYQLFVFDIYNIIDQEYFNYQELVDFCEVFDLPMVPIEKDNYLITEEDTVKSFLEMAKGRYDSGQHQEGIVVRPQELTFSQRLRDRASFKVINNDFLLKQK